MKCEECKWWDRDEKEENEAPCRRRSPTQTWGSSSFAGGQMEADGIVQSCDDHGLWPITNNYDWCGDFSF